MANFPTRRPHERGDWVWSTEITHEPIITAEEFARAEELRSRHSHRATTKRARPTPRPYLLRKLVRCGICGRSMDANWNHCKAHYRCRVPSEYAQRKGLEHPKTVYLRESVVVPKLDEWLASLFHPDNLDATCEALAMAQEVDEAAIARAEAARRKIAHCDDRLTKYRNALEAGADAAIVGGWIAEVRAEREQAEADIEGAKPAEPLTRAEVKAIVLAMKDMARVLRRADPKLKAEVYADLGLTLTYHPDQRKVAVEADPSIACAKVRVGGAFDPAGTRGTVTGELDLAA